MEFFSYLCKVKDEHIDIDRMVMESHYLDSLEREQEANIPMGNMITLEEHNKQIQELRDTIKNLNGIISTMRMTMDSLRASNDKSYSSPVYYLQQNDVIYVEMNKKEKRNATDRKSTRLNSSHQIISYAVFCLKKKTSQNKPQYVIDRRNHREGTRAPPTP